MVGVPALPALLGVGCHFQTHEVHGSCVDGESVPRNQRLQHGHNIRNVGREAVLSNVRVDQVIVGGLIVHGRVCDGHMVGEGGLL